MRWRSSEATHYTGADVPRIASSVVAERPNLDGSSVPSSSVGSAAAAAAFSPERVSRQKGRSSGHTWASVRRCELWRGPRRHRAWWKRCLRRSRRGVLGHGLRRGYRRRDVAGRVGEDPHALEFIRTGLESRGDGVGRGLTCSGYEDRLAGARAGQLAPSDSLRIRAAARAAA